MKSSRLDVYKKNVEVDVKAEITRNVRDEIINLKNKDFRAKLSHYASTPSPAKKNKKKRKHHKRPRSASSGKSEQIKQIKQLKQVEQVEQVERLRF